MTNFITKFGVIGCLTIALTGCGMTPEEEAAAFKAQAEARKVADEAACKSYGLKPNTDAFALCIQNEVNARKQRAAAYNAAQRAAIIWGD